MNRPVILYPDPTLRMVSAPIEPSDLVDPDFLKLVDDLKETLAHARGAAISAIQVGVPKRLIVVSPEVTGGILPEVYINPVVALGVLEEKVEGCLSMPGICVSVMAPRTVAVEAIGLDGAAISIAGAGDFAQALAHEAEHLDGKLLVDKAKPVKREMIERRCRKRKGKMYLYQQR